MTKSILDSIGDTPVVKLEKINNNDSAILAKVEALEPSGSIKDIMAIYMINAAEERGILKPGAKIIELTSGNTGISFAMISCLKGYKFTAMMPANMSKERRQMMEAFGAKIVLSPVEEGFPGAVKRFDELAKQNPDAWLPRQFDNPDNIAAHREITARRILEDVKDRIDAFVCGVGTGGTLMGVAEALKKVYPGVKIVAVEPAESAVMSGGGPGLHMIQGIGPGFIPSLVNMDMVDEVVAIKGEDAVDMARELTRKEGLMMGISSGANVLAALKVADELGENKTIVTILPDRGERYLSMDLF